jgi:predicted DNA binding protein
MDPKHCSQRLSDDQLTLLRSAVTEGYFAVPRAISLDELGENHGLSDREASEQLRRDVDHLVRDELLDS